MLFCCMRSYFRLVSKIVETILAFLHLIAFIFINHDFLRISLVVARVFPARQQDGWQVGCVGIFLVGTDLSLGSVAILWIARSYRLFGRGLCLCHAAVGFRPATIAWWSCKEGNLLTLFSCRDQVLILSLGLALVTSSTESKLLVVGIQCPVQVGAYIIPYYEALYNIFL